MLSIVDLSLAYGARVLYEDVYLTIGPKSRYGLVGANGCGKTTFLKILNKEIEPSSGEIAYQDGLAMGSLKQDYYLYEEDSLVNVVLRGKPKLWKAVQLKNAFLEKEHLTESEISQFLEAEEEIALQDGYVAEGIITKLLLGLGFEEKRHHDSLKAFSGGYKMRVMLAQLLFGSPDLLLLDEPTNYLDILSISWLEMYLKSFHGAMIISSHDRYFLNQVCTDILDVDFETISLYKGNYEDFVLQKISILEEKKKSAGNLDKKQKHLQEFIDRFGAKASKASQAQSKVKAVEKLEKEKKKFEIGTSSRKSPNLHFKMNVRPPSIYLKVEGLAKAFGEKKVLTNVCFELEKNDKLAIVGPNGVGKSTLLEILNERQQSDRGKIEWSSMTKCAYFPQAFEKELKLEQTVEDWLYQATSITDYQKIRATLGGCLFKDEDLHKKIEMLSGGEKARLYLAKLMLSDHNLLIFDEPTNHLDLESMESLIQVLKSYEGGLIIVSHDRYFISQLGTKILELNFEGSYFFLGSYEEYLAKRERDFFSKDLKIHQIALEKPPASLKGKKEGEKIKILRKKLKEVEKRCAQNEIELQKHHQTMVSEDFYKRFEKEQIASIIKEKEGFEQKLEEDYKLWEQFSQEIEKNEKD